MPHLSEPRFLVLHGLRLKGLADPVAVARATGVDSATAAEIFADLETDSLAIRRSGRITGWTLTAAGRAEHQRLVAGDLETAGCRSAVHGAYERFVEVNPELLATCTAWQLREVDRNQVPNDHTDAAYDGAVLARLGRVDERVQPTCAGLAAVMERFGPYGERLGGARRRVETGDTEWFTRPDIDSYHSVWFELHEDLLMTLGLERGREVVPSTTGSRR